MPWRADYGAPACGRHAQKTARAADEDPAHGSTYESARSLTPGGNALADTDSFDLDVADQGPRWKALVDDDQAKLSRVEGVQPVFLLERLHRRDHDVRAPERAGLGVGHLDLER